MNHFTPKVICNPLILLVTVITKPRPLLDLGKFDIEVSIERNLLLQEGREKRKSVDCSYLKEEREGAIYEAKPGDLRRRSARPRDLLPHNLNMTWNC